MSKRLGFKDLLSLSIGTVINHKLRSALTVLGIIIGITAVVILTAIGNGIHRYVLNEFTQFGTNLIAVMPGKKNVYGMSGATINSVRPLTLQDAAQLTRLDNVLEVVPLLQGNARIESAHRQRRAAVFGVGPAVPEVWKIRVKTGRFLPKGELHNPRAFAVLGSKLYDELFAGQNPLGQIVRVGDDRFRVIGVMEPKGQMLGFDLDDSIYIPAAKAMQLFNRQGLMEIDLLYAPDADLNSITDAIVRLLVSRHGQQDFNFVTQKQMLETLDSILNILTLAVASLGAISLLVGSVGIATIMTIAVSERIAEIGLLRALGAEQSMIFQLFLSEALLLSGAGGIIGIVTGLLIVQLITVLLPQLPVQLALDYCLAAFVMSLLIGLISGVLPALKAARLLPLEALRAE